MNLIFLALICIFGRTLGQPENLKTELRSILGELLGEKIIQDKLRSIIQTDCSTGRETRLKTVEQHLANVLGVQVGSAVPSLSTSTATTLYAKRIVISNWTISMNTQKKLVFADAETQNTIEFNGKDNGFATNYDGKVRPSIGGTSSKEAGLIVRMSSWTIGRVGTNPNFVLEQSLLKQSTLLSADATKGLTWTNFGTINANALNLGIWSINQSTNKTLAFTENESKTTINFNGRDSGFATNPDTTNPRPSISGSAVSGAGLIVRMADYAMGRIRGSDGNFGFEHSSMKQVFWLETTGTGFKWNNLGLIQDINIGKAIVLQDMNINGKATIKEVSAVTGTVSQQLRIGTNWVILEKNEQLEFVNSNGNRIKFSGKDLYYPDPDDKPQTRASISGDGDGRKEGGLNIHFGPQWKVVENYMSFQLELTNKYSLNTMLFSGYDRAAIETKKSGSVKLCCV
ncbi:hypothetical protein BJ742DRAFT_819873, partial [Cladochytrium replicatum]